MKMMDRIRKYRALLAILTVFLFVAVFWTPIYSRAVGPAATFVLQIGTAVLSGTNPAPVKVQYGTTAVSAENPLPITGAVTGVSISDVTVSVGETPVSVEAPFPVHDASATTLTGVVGAVADAAVVDPESATATHMSLMKGLLTEQLLIASYTKPKGTTVALFGGAISASVAEADATVIDMRGHNGGSLDALVNSGTGTYSFAVYTSETGTGVFHAMYQEKADKSGQEVRPAIVTIASTSTSFSLSGIRANYLKLVPTLSGTANITFTFTPTKN